MEHSRTRNSIFNVGTGFFNTIVKTILTFITRTIFIKILGETYLGLNGLLTNILSMLSIAELGIGTTISFSLYKPLANKDNKKINALMTFYKKAYRIIGAIILIGGIILIPFLRFILEEDINIKHIYLIYILYLLTTVSTYFIAYKEVLIIADQKNYKLTKINFIFDILLNVMQIIELLIFKSFVLYLVVQLIIEYVRRIIINSFISKEYPETDFYSKEKISKEDKNTLSKNVKAMFLHKIGDYSINGTDNIIMTKFVGLNAVGLYSNYLTIITMLNTFINIIYNSITSSLGNLIAKEKEEKRLKVFNIMDFIGFCIYGYCSACLFALFNPFIKVWAGEQYLFSTWIVAVIVLNFYMTGMRIPLGTIKSAAGVYSEDKYIPLIQAVTNIVVSIILAKYIGVLGVLLGTLISSLIPAVNRPYIVYKYVFNKKVTEYYKRYLKNIIVFIFVTTIITIVTNILNVTNSYIQLVVTGIIATIIYMGIIIIIYRKTDEFIFVKNQAKEIFLKIKNRK